MGIFLSKYRPAGCSTGLEGTIRFTKTVGKAQSPATLWSKPGSERSQTPFKFPHPIRHSADMVLSTFGVTTPKGHIITQKNNPNRCVKQL